jgi:hypothetical protein
VRLRPIRPVFDVHRAAGSASTAAGVNAGVDATGALPGIGWASPAVTMLRLAARADASHM